MTGRARQQKILTPTFDPKKSPGYRSRFSNNPFQKFFGDWQVPLIEKKAETVGPFSMDQEMDPVKQFRSQQDTRTIPSRMKK